MEKISWFIYWEFEESLSSKLKVFSFDLIWFLLQLFNIHYDEYQSESQFSKQGQEIINQLTQLGYCKQRSDGVLETIIPAKYNTLPRDACVVIQKSDGTTLYITRLVPIDNLYSINNAFIII